MTKDDLEQIKGLKSEIKAIQDDLHNLPITKDSVTGSMVDFPYIQRTVVISGLDEDKGKKLRKRLEKKLDELQDMLLEMENWLDTIPDSEIRAILRLKYRNGMTNKQIGDELGYDQSSISKKINNLLSKM